MIDVRAKGSGDEIEVEFIDFDGTVAELLEEIACINGAVIGNIILNGIPEGCREKEYAAFLTQELTKRTKQAVQEVLDRENVSISDIEQVTDKPNKTVKDILKRFEDGTNNGKLN